VHKHLRRLERVWLDSPIYFITTCIFERRPILGSRGIAAIFMQEWRTARQRHGWAIGRYAIMPDHVHFFCRAELSAKPLRIFMQKWKQWTSKRIARENAVAGIDDPGLKESRTLWQEEFFDHVLRSNESYSQKWEYVKVNPIRAGLVKKSDDWPFHGQIESVDVVGCFPNRDHRSRLQRGLLACRKPLPKPLTSILSPQAGRGGKQPSTFNVGFGCLLRRNFAEGRWLLNVSPCILTTSFLFPGRLRFPKKPGRRFRVR